MSGWLDIFLQPRCPLCRRSTPVCFCLDCDRAINACIDRQIDHTSLGIPLFSWGIYDGILKRSIAACKYENQPKIAQALGLKMAQAWQEGQFNRSGITVVPIPLHSERQKIRGFNQAEVLARSFCDRTKIECSPQLLARTKNTKPQIETKSKQERAENLSNAFIAQKPTRKSDPIWLFDDIYTSGATVREAIAAFKAVGIKVGGAIVLAKPKT